MTSSQSDAIATWGFLAVLRNVHWSSRRRHTAERTFPLPGPDTVLRLDRGI